MTYLTDKEKQEALDDFDACTMAGGLINGLEPKTREIIRAALSQTLEWRDIETAPRDGTRIIILCNCGLICIGIYSKSSNKFVACASYFKIIPIKWTPFITPPKPTEKTDVENN